MATKQLEAAVRKQGSVAVIDLRGEIDAFGEEVLNKTYAEAEASQPSAILLNFSAVEYINSTGIALIVGLLARARKSGSRLLTTGLSSHYLEIFQITRLADFMHIYPDEASALAHATA
jgi:anti-anti-sigma factor